MQFGSENCYLQMIAATTIASHQCIHTYRLKDLLVKRRLVAVLLDDGVKVLYDRLGRIRRLSGLAEADSDFLRRIGR